MLERGGAQSTGGVEDQFLLSRRINHKGEFADFQELGFHNLREESLRRRSQEGYAPPLIRSIPKTVLGYWSLKAHMENHGTLEKSEPQTRAYDLFHQLLVVKEQLPSRLSPQMKTTFERYEKQAEQRDCLAICCKKYFVHRAP